MRNRLHGNHKAQFFAGWPIVGPKPGMPIVFILIVVMGISACSAPKRAPVSSRELSSNKTTSIKSTATSYRIKKGDTLFAIAWEHGVEMEDLARWNNLSPPYLIYPGQKIRLTAPKTAVSKSQRKSPYTSKRLPPKRATTVTPNEKPVQKSVPKVTDNSSVQTTAERVKLSWSWPTQGKVQEHFSPNDPSRKGIKITGRPGQSVRAAESGKVVYAGSGLIGYGRLIIIKHNKNYLSAYGYNRKILVKEGDQVSKGSQIAEMGTNNRSGSVLHFEIRRNGTPVDPIKLLPRS